MQRKFVAENERKEGFTHVVLITTGSVASIKAPLIVAELLTVRECSPLWVSGPAYPDHEQYRNVKVEVVSTEASLSFYDHQEIEKTGVRVWRNKDEWGPYVSVKGSSGMIMLICIPCRESTKLGTRYCT